jgi:primary-amine oxidase
VACWCGVSASAAQEAARPDQPLEPLTREEIGAAVALLRAEGKAGEHTRFTVITLNEPAKDQVLRFAPGSPLIREAFVTAYDYDGDRTFEGVVDLTTKRVTSWKQRAGVEPPVIKDEDNRRVTEILRADPRWRAAMQRHGLEPDTVRASAYPVGPFAPPGEQGRLAIAQNDGVMAYVNLTTRKIAELADNGLPPSRAPVRQFQPDALGTPRAGANPLEVVQPGGPSFTLHGHEVRWQNWRFRFGMRPREGLVLYTVGYDDNGSVRSILYRASLSELFVPYGYLGEGRFYLTAFDAGEAGLGSYGDITMSPADCPANAAFVGAVMHDYLGNPREIPRATCLYEREGGCCGGTGTRFAAHRSWSCRPSCRSTTTTMGSTGSSTRTEPWSSRSC